MKKSFCLLVLVALLPATAGMPRKIPCKTTANATRCNWTHGRLAFYNGTPAFRIWKIGTHRVLGVVSGASVKDELDNEHPELPGNLQDVYSPLENRIFADFEVCPLEEEKPGVMQSVCIESAKNIFVQEL